MSTPEGRSKNIKDSIVSKEGISRSKILLWVRISKCSLESLFTCGDLSTQKIFFLVGNGTGPDIIEFVLETMEIIFLQEESNVETI